VSEPVKDYTKCRKIFDADATAHKDAGLILKYIGREKNKGSTIFFIFDVIELAIAKAFISAPDAKEQAARSGVLGGDYHFLESADVYQGA